jgi:hypothetical protein
MKVIARQGKARWLIDAGGEQGRILDSVEAKVYPPQWIASIVARGYWEPATMSQSELDALLAKATMQE